MSKPTTQYAVLRQFPGEDEPRVFGLRHRTRESAQRMIDGECYGPGDYYVGVRTVPAWEPVEDASERPEPVDLGAFYSAVAKVDKVARSGSPNEIIDALADVGTFAGRLADEVTFLRAEIEQPYSSYCVAVRTPDGAFVPLSRRFDTLGEVKAHVETEGISLGRLFVLVGWREWSP